LRQLLLPAFRRARFPHYPRLAGYNPLSPDPPLELLMVEPYIGRNYSGPARRRWPFDSPNPVSCAVLVPVLALADRCAGRAGWGRNSVLLETAYRAESGPEASD
jgi:hypothetical protein